MKLGVMQPYLFPYIGYFQLINAVDQFIIYDNVQWINRGWINRNRILINGQAHTITLPIKKAPSHQNINERELPADIHASKLKIIKQIELAYRNAPYFDEIFPLLNDCFLCTEQNVSIFVTNSLQRCCDYIGIDTPFSYSSDLSVNSELKGEQRIIEINRVVGSKHYVNPVGGIDLYHEKTFAENNLKLSFLKSHDIHYTQFQKNDFIPNLSIIDVLMFNSKEQIHAFLYEYDLI